MSHLLAWSCLEITVVLPHALSPGSFQLRAAELWTTVARSVWLVPGSGQEHVGTGAQQNGLPLVTDPQDEFVLSTGFSVYHPCPLHALPRADI